MATTTASNKGANPERQTASARYQKIARELLPNAKGAQRQALLDELRGIGEKYGFNWQDSWKKFGGAPINTGTPGAGAPVQPTEGGPPVTDPSAGGAQTGVNTTLAQLQEGLKLGKELYPGGSLGRLNNPAPIGPLGPIERVGLIDPNSIADVDVIDPNAIPQVKEISDAMDQGLVASIGQWEDYYAKTQQRDAAMDAAVQRANQMATEGYSSADMQAKRAKAGREVDMQTETALRDMRKSQGANANFGGVAAAAQGNLSKDALRRKALLESELMAGDADFKLSANQQAGNLGIQSYQTYNNAQQAGLKGLTDTRGMGADDVYKKRALNADIQGKNQTGYLTAAQQKLSAQTANQGKALGIATGNQGAQGINATNALNWEKSNKEIEGGNLTREQDATKFNMGQSEKEKAGQIGTMFGWKQYTDAQDIQTQIQALQRELNAILAQEPK